MLTLRIVFAIVIASATVAAQDAKNAAEGNHHHYSDGTSVGRLIRLQNPEMSEINSPRSGSVAGAEIETAKVLVVGNAPTTLRTITVPSTDHQNKDTTEPGQMLPTATKRHIKRDYEPSNALEVFQQAGYYTTQSHVSVVYSTYTPPGPTINITVTRYVPAQVEPPVTIYSTKWV